MPPALRPRCHRGALRLADPGFFTLDVFAQMSQTGVVWLACLLTGTAVCTAAGERWAVLALRQAQQGSRAAPLICRSARAGGTAGPRVCAPATSPRRWRISVVIACASAPTYKVVSMRRYVSLIYPHLSEFVMTHGWIEIGQDDFSQPFIRALDIGGMI